MTGPQRNPGRRPVEPAAASLRQKRRPNQPCFCGIGFVRAMSHPARRRALDVAGTGSDIMATKHQPSQSAKNFTHPTYRVIEARMADARRARGAMLGWHGLWPAGIVAGV